MPNLDNFFETNIIKNTFESVRNLLISSTVLVAGLYLIKKVSPKAVWELTSLTFGYVLVGTAAVLFLACVLETHYKISKNIEQPIIRWSVALLYLFIATLTLLSILQFNSTALR